MKTGDLVVAVDGEAAAKWSRDEAARRIRGPAGSRVTLTLERHGATHVIVVERARFVPDG